MRSLLFILLSLPLAVAAQTGLDDFIKGQPIIDMHFHVTAGDSASTVYATDSSDPTIAKLDWMLSDFSRNNIVLAVGGGNRLYAEMYAKKDSLFWTGLIFPCSNLVAQDSPCEKEFYNEGELRQLYQSGLLRTMGESMFNYYGIPPTDERLKPYWKVASELNIPVGIHADTGPRPERVNKAERPNYDPALANPLLLKPILEEYPNLRLYLMHFGGGYSDEAMELMKAYPQIYCDMTAVTLFAPRAVWEPNLKKLFDAKLGDRLMFGSDYFNTVRQNIEVVYSLTWLTDDQKRDILYNNAARFLQLSPELIELHHQQLK